MKKSITMGQPLEVEIDQNQEVPFIKSVCANGVDITDALIETGANLDKILATALNQTT